MLIEEFLTASWREPIAQVQVDPLREPDTLQETQLLEVRIDALKSVAGLLFELRTALNIAEGNTGLIVARGVREFSWSADARITDRTAWNVVGSEPGRVDELYSLDLDFLPRAGLRVVADSAEFYGGNVNGLPQHLPDYGLDDEPTLRSNLAGWQSSFTPSWATRINPRPS